MIKNLVFSGGGTMCISYIGILKFFEENPELKQNIKNISSSSGGSLFALVFILGYTYTDLKNLVLGLDFTKIQDSGF